MGRIAIWARPASSHDHLSWDPWRRRWVVACRARAAGGAANDSICALVAGWLGVSTEQVRWARAGRSRAKVLEVDGLSDPELYRRLRRASTGSPR